MSYLSKILERGKFGKVKEYKKGDVVIWRGNSPCIGKIKSKCKYDFEKDCFVICDSHNSLHYSHLRLATNPEKKILGRKRILLFNQLNQSK